MGPQARRAASRLRAGGDPADDPAAAVTGINRPFAAGSTSSDGPFVSTLHSFAAFERDHAWTRKLVPELAGVHEDARGSSGSSSRRECSSASLPMWCSSPARDEVGRRSAMTNESPYRAPRRGSPLPTDDRRQHVGIDHGRRRHTATAGRDVMHVCVVSFASRMWKNKLCDKSRAPGSWEACGRCLASEWARFSA